MAFYTIFFLIILFLLQSDKVLKIKGASSFFLAYVIIFLVCALRFDVGWDYVSYYDLIERNIKFYDAQLSIIEPMNRWLIAISQYLGFTQLYFIVTSFIICFSFYRTFKNHSSDFAVSTLLFLSLPIFFFNSLSIIRQFVAVAIMMYSLRFIQSRDLFRFSIIVVVAILFHKSAIVAIPLYFLYERKVHFYFFPIIFALGFFSSEILYWLVEHLLPRYLKFLDGLIGQGGNKVLLLFQALGFILLFFVNRVQSNKKENNFYFLIFYIGLFIWSSLAKYGHAGMRGGLYYTVFLLLLIPNILTELKQRKLMRQLTFLACIVFFGFTLYLGKSNIKKDPNLPYRTFFFKTRVDIEKIPE